MLKLFITVVITLCLFGCIASDNTHNGPSRTAVNVSVNAVQVIYLNVNGSIVPCAFYNYGSYGGAAIDCDWKDYRR